MGQNTVYLFTYDWKQEKGGRVILLQVTDNRSACGASYSAARFEHFEVADFNRDGLPDLGVTVQAGLVPCGRQPSYAAMPRSLVQFLFDGKDFRVSPGTAAAKRKLDALNRP